MNQTEKQTKNFTAFNKFLVKIKLFFSGVNNKIQRSQLESLPIALQKGIEIAKLCIENNQSKLYSLPKHSTFSVSEKSGIQIETPDIIITIEQTNGFYEADFVYIGQAVPTSDKLIYDMSGIYHIFEKFDKEVAERMKENRQKRDVVVEKHLDNILLAANKNK